MPETTKSSTPEPSQDPTETEAEDVLPATTSQLTYLQDDGHGPLPDGVVQHPEPVTYLADHVPENAPTHLATKVVTTAAAKPAPASPAVVETA